MQVSVPSTLTTLGTKSKSTLSVPGWSLIICIWASEKTTSQTILMDSSSFVQNRAIMKPFLGRATPNIHRPNSLPMLTKTLKLLGTTKSLPVTLISGPVKVLNRHVHRKRRRRRWTGIQQGSAHEMYSILASRNQITVKHINVRWWTPTDHYMALAVNTSISIVGCQRTFRIFSTPS